MFTQVVNEGRSKVVFSFTSIQRDFFLHPMPPGGHQKDCSFKSTICNNALQI